MPTATVTVTRNKNIEPDTLGRHCEYYGNLTVSPAADFYTTGGLTMSFAGVSGIVHHEPPVACRVWSETPGNGYLFMYVTGTTNANGKLVVLASLTVVTGTGPTVVEMTNSTAIPAAISGDTKLRWCARWIHGK